MKKTKRIHIVYKEWLSAKKEGIITPQLFEKWQYIYSSPKGEISLVKLADNPMFSLYGGNLWEIYSLKGNLFEDVERFDSQEKAEAQIKKYL